MPHGSATAIKYNVGKRNQKNNLHIKLRSTKRRQFQKCKQERNSDSRKNEVLVCWRVLAILNVIWKVRVVFVRYTLHFHMSLIRLNVWKNFSSIAANCSMHLEVRTQPHTFDKYSFCTRHSFTNLCILHVYTTQGNA